MKLPEDGVVFDSSAWNCPSSNTISRDSASDSLLEQGQDIPQLVSPDEYTFLEGGFGTKPEATLSPASRERSNDSVSAPVPVSKIQDCVDQVVARRFCEVIDGINENCNKNATAITQRIGEVSAEVKASNRSAEGFHEAIESVKKDLIASYSLSTTNLEARIKAILVENQESFAEVVQREVSTAVGAAMRSNPDTADMVTTVGNTVQEAVATAVEGLDRSSSLTSVVDSVTCGLRQVVDECLQSRLEPLAAELMQRRLPDNGESVDGRFATSGNLPARDCEPKEGSRVGSERKSSEELEQQVQALSNKLSEVSENTRLVEEQNRKIDLLSAQVAQLLEHVMNTQGSAPTTTQITQNLASVGGGLPDSGVRHLPFPTHEVQQRPAFESPAPQAPSVHGSEASVRGSLVKPPTPSFPRSQGLNRAAPESSDSRDAFSAGTIAEAARRRQEAERYQREAERLQREAKEAEAARRRAEEEKRIEDERQKKAALGTKTRNILSSLISHEPSTAGRPSLFGEENSGSTIKAGLFDD